MPTVVHNLRKSQRGATLVEFALTLPLFLLIIMGILDFGRAFNAYNTMSNAAREGARVGVIPTKTDDDIRLQVQQKGLLLNLTYADIAVSGRAPGERFTVTVTHRFDPITPLIASLLPGEHIDLTASASMREEH